MKIKTTKTHTLTFSVRYFEETEGGMASEGFGKDCFDIGRAVSLLELAKAERPEHKWLIACEVQTEVASSSA